MEPHGKLKKRVVRHFLEVWLTDEQSKSWIRKVPLDNTLFRCIACNKNYSCTSSVKRHAESEYHRKNVERNASSSCDPNTDVISKKSHEEESLEPGTEQFKSWLRKIQNGNLFFCIICDKIFSGDLQIHHHLEFKMHKDRMLKDQIPEDQVYNNQTDKNQIQRDQMHKHQIYKDQNHNDQIHEDLIYKSQLYKDQIHEYSIHNDFETSDIKIESTHDVKIESMCNIKIELKEEIEIDNMQINENMQIDENLRTDENMQTEKPYMMFDERQKLAEIRFATFIANKNIPFDTAKAILEFFQNIHPKHTAILSSMEHIN